VRGSLGHGAAAAFAAPVTAISSRERKNASMSRGRRPTVEPMRRPLSVFWRVFAVNAGLLGVLAALLLFSPVEIDAPIKATQALTVAAALVVTLVANAVLLRRALSPLEHLAQRMEGVDLLRPGQRLRVLRTDEISRVVVAFNRMLDRLESERRESGRRVLAAQEAERVGIARDLHDEVGQVLTGVLLQLGSIAERTPAQRGEIDEAKQSVRRALDEIRRISSELRPEMLEHLGLVSALTELTATFSRVSGILVDRQFEQSLPQLEPDAELAVYRIAQESLTNVARHAEATRVTVALAAGVDTLVLRVVDNGRGFAAEPREHGGLRSMRERALLIGATLAIEPASPAGVEVRLEVPALRTAHAMGATR
jgi:two-component system, NarL family, sensor histidine kinase UhpB